MLQPGGNIKEDEINATWKPRGMRSPAAQRVVQLAPRPGDTRPARPARGILRMHQHLEGRAHAGAQAAPGAVPDDGQALGRFRDPPAACAACKGRMQSYCYRHLAVRLLGAPAERRPLLAAPPGSFHPGARQGRAAASSTARRDATLWMGALEPGWELCSGSGLTVRSLPGAQELLPEPGGIGGHAGHRRTPGSRPQEQVDGRDVGRVIRDIDILVGVVRVGLPVLLGVLEVGRVAWGERHERRGRGWASRGAGLRRAAGRGLGAACRRVMPPAGAASPKLLAGCTARPPFMPRARSGGSHADYSKPHLLRGAARPLRT